MIAEAGLAALWFAAALALLQLVLAAIGVRATRVAVADGARGSGTPAFAGEQGVAAGILAAVRPVAVVHGALAVLAMGLLIALFLRSDLRSDARRVGKEGVRRCRCGGGPCQ